MKRSYRKETDGIIGLCVIVILVYYRKGFRKKATATVETVIIIYFKKVRIYHESEEAF
ncbi:hypothetical protein D3C76_1518080 [compost metagenome]